jgi:hypothetical protein
MVMFCVLGIVAFLFIRLRLYTNDDVFNIRSQHQ